jgi:hypothetical protein
MNKTYKIVSFHNVYEDNYEKGELKQVNSYVLDAIIEAKNHIAAIQKYFSDSLYYSFNIDNAGKEETDCLHYSNLVDGDNLEASKSDIELWKCGDKILYSNNTIIEVFEVKKCDIN